MKKLFLLFVCFLLSAQAALAQSSTIPLGFPQDTVQNVDANAQVFLRAAPAAGTFPNYRLLSPTARFTVTDNGAGGNWVLELATVDLAHGGTNAVNQQGAVNSILGFPSITTGDMTYYNGTNWVRLPIGSGTQLLGISGGIPAWTSAGAAVNANAKFILQASDVSMPNAQVLTAGTGITLTPIAGTSETVAIDSTVLTTTSTQSGITNKSFDGASLGWNAGGGLTLKGSVNNNKLLWADWGASAGNITIPLVNGTTAANIVLDQGTQTLAGTYTFSNAPKLNTNTITSSTGLTITFPNSTDTVVNLGSAQTLTSKTLTSPIISNNATAMTFQQSGGNYTISTANPAGARTYTIYDAAGAGDFAIKSGTPTAGGAAYADGNLIKFTGAGSSGAPLVSGGAGAPSFTTLLVPGGGTGITTTTQGDLLVGAAGNTFIKLAKGTANQSLQMDGTGTNLVWVTGGGSGTVTSVSGPSIITWATPTTTPTGTLNTQAAATRLAGPINNASGAAPAAATPTFRVDDVTDIPVFEANVRVYSSAGVPVDTADQTALTTLKVGPYLGNHVTIYNTTQSKWINQPFSEVSVSVPATTVTPFDIFITSAGNTTVTASTVNWTNDTTRATALTLLNGRYVSSGNNALLYVATARTTTVSGQTENSAAKRFVWNYYNRQSCDLTAQDPAASFAANTTNSWVSMDSNTTDGQGRIAFVCGVVEDPIRAVMGVGVSAGGLGQFGLGLNSTTVNAAKSFQRSNNASYADSAIVQMSAMPSAGYNYVQGLCAQYSGGGAYTIYGTTTTPAANAVPYGVATSIHGSWRN